MLHEDDIIFK